MATSFRCESVVATAGCGARGSPVAERCTFRTDTNGFGLGVLPTGRKGAPGSPRGRHWGLGSFGSWREIAHKGRACIFAEISNTIQALSRSFRHLPDGFDGVQDRLLGFAHQGPRNREQKKSGSPAGSTPWSPRGPMISSAAGGAMMQRKDARSPRTPLCIMSGRSLSDGLRQVAGTNLVSGLSENFQYRGPAAVMHAFGWRLISSPISARRRTPNSYPRQVGCGARKWQPGLLCQWACEGRQDPAGASQ